MRFYIIKDGTIIGSTATKEQAIVFIDTEKKFDTHWLKPNYWIIKGEEEFIQQSDGAKAPVMRSGRWSQAPTATDNQIRKEQPKCKYV